VKSAAHWDPKKLAWVNNHYIKAADNERLAALLMPSMLDRGARPEATHLAKVVALMKDRCDTLAQLADSAMLFYRDVDLAAALQTTPVDAAVVPALEAFVAGASSIAWDRASIAALLKSVLAAHGLKMPQLAMPLRVLVAGQKETPSADATLELFGKDVVIDRVRAGLPLLRR
jgi:glutamyl-tRNA synthetase